jgi:hypothetical protein
MISEVAAVLFLCIIGPQVSAVCLPEKPRRGIELSSTKPSSCRRPKLVVRWSPIAPPWSNWSLLEVWNYTKDLAARYVTS